MRHELAPGKDKLGTVYAISVETGDTTWLYEQRASTTSLVATGGRLLFGGDTNGRFKAYDQDTGEVLWEVLSQTGIMAPPVTYEVDGEQYVLVAAGWGGGALAGPRVEEAIINRYHNEGRVLAFKLGGTAAMPENQPRDTTVPVPLTVTASADEIARGKSLYHRECVLCHGFAAESSLIVPDLRYLSSQRHEQFNDIVLGGLFDARGMPSFASSLSADEAALVHQYINTQAQKLYASQSNDAR